jgi:hypothetical protein
MKRFVVFVMALILLGLAAFSQVVPPPTRKIDRVKSLNVVEPKDVRLNKNEVWLFVPNTPGSRYQLVATVIPDNATNKKITWKSSDRSVATVGLNGLVVPQGVGTTIVTAISQANGREASCRVVVEKAAKFFGNTISNLMNGGRLARQGSWIYFSDPLRGSRLSKMKIDGSRLTPLCDDVPSAINVWRDKIYYINGSDGKKLYSIDIYGENRKWLGDSNPAYGAQYYGGEIIYGSQDPSNRINLYTIKADGTGRRVVDWPGLGNVSFFYRAGDYVLYSLLGREAGKPPEPGLILYRSMESASAATQVYGGAHRGFVATIDENDVKPIFVMVYYLTASGEIRRVKKPRFKDKQEDSLFISPRPAATTLSYDQMGWIYYANDRGVNKIRGTGAENQMLAQIPANTAAIIYPVALGTTPEETWVFYYVIPQGQNMGPARIFRVRGNGLDNIQLR